MNCLTFVHVLSPLHAGTGQGVGVIDLPIAREKATNLPYLPGSTLKGTLRDLCEATSGEATAREVFGEGGESTAKSGLAILSDQKLLCLPVRSLYGTFAWVTSPYILERFKRDCQHCEVKVSCEVQKPGDETRCFVTTESKLKKGDQVFLEDLDLNASDGASTTDWAEFLAPKIFADTEWQHFFRERFCIVSDDVMGFLAETATEVTARNRLDDEKKTTVRGALWYEEALPTETILSGVLSTIANGDKANEVVRKIEKLIGKPFWLGGHTTVGRGLCRVILYSGGNGNANA
jgi:CRISPR-associated protein Cmr4